LLQILEAEEAKMDPAVIQEQQKQEVLAAIVQQVRDEIEDPKMPLAEIADNGIFELGLDSLNIMQLSDYIKTNYSVHLTFSELTDLDTLGKLSRAVVKQSPVLKKALAQKSTS